MHIKFTYHANFRREERGISVERIKQTIRAPDIVDTKASGKLLHVKKFPDKTISVAFFISGNTYIIITVF